jgi:[acyl-carrier-protein] S-malonyltransferase
LNVSGAFHSPLMEPARRILGDVLEGTTFREAGIPVVSNVTAGPVTDPGEVLDLLARQLTSPVLWSQSMQYIFRQGVSSFMEVGPGTVLCGLLKRIAPDAACVSCSDTACVAELLKEG